MKNRQQRSLGYLGCARLTKIWSVIIVVVVVGMRNKEANERLTNRTGYLIDWKPCAEFIAFRMETMSYGQKQLGGWRARPSIGFVICWNGTTKKTTSTKRVCSLINIRVPITTDKLNVKAVSAPVCVRIINGTENINFSYFTSITARYYTII